MPIKFVPWTSVVSNILMYSEYRIGTISTRAKSAKNGTRKSQAFLSESFFILERRFFGVGDLLTFAVTWLATALFRGASCGRVRVSGDIEALLVSVVDHAFLPGFEHAPKVSLAVCVEVDSDVFVLVASPLEERRV